MEQIDMPPVGKLFHIGRWSHGEPCLKRDSQGRDDHWGRDPRDDVSTPGVRGAQRVAVLTFIVASMPIRREPDLWETRSVQLSHGNRLPGSVGTRGHMDHSNPSCRGRVLIHHDDPPRDPLTVKMLPGIDCCG